MNLKKTIKLQELKVVSFTTSLTKEGQSKIYGGDTNSGCSGGPNCKSEASIRQHFHRDGAVTALAGLLISSPREKVTRLALSSLRNLAQIDPDFVQEMIGCGVQKSVKLLMDRQWTDPDIIEGACS